MTVSFVGSASAEATSLTLPAHQRGDLLIIVASSSASATPVTPPTGWLSCSAIAGLNTDSMRVAWKVAESAAEVSGTWTGASLLVCAVYRETTYVHGVSQATGTRSGAGGSSSPAYPQKAAWTVASVTPSTDRMMSNSAVVVGIICSTSTAISLAVAPSGMTNRASHSGVSANQIAIHDTGSAVGSWASTTATLSGATPWITQVIELVDTGYAKTAAASFRPVNIRGGADQ